MTTRQIYKERFGPKALEAIVLVIRDEINLLRQEHGLPARTGQQILDAVGEKYSSLPDL